HVRIIRKVQKASPASVHCQGQNRSSSQSKTGDKNARFGLEDYTPAARLRASPPSTLTIGRIGSYVEEAREPRPIAICCWGQTPYARNYQNVSEFPPHCSTSLAASASPSSPPPPQSPAMSLAPAPG